MKRKKSSGHYSAPPSNRLRQVNELLRAELASEFTRELELPVGTVVTITRIVTSPDLRNATIYILVQPDNQSGTVLAIVRKKLRDMIHTVSHRIVLKNLPKFKVEVDEAERKAARVDELLDSLEEI